MHGTHKTGTKTIATLGPATATEESIEQLVRAGLDAVRLNLSHSERESHREILEMVRAVSKRMGAPVAVMGDICGPKIRLLDIENGAVELGPAQRLDIIRTPVLGNAERVSSNSPEMIDDVQIGHRVLIDDGAVRLRVVDKNDEGLVCQCEVAGVIKNRKGLNLPDSDLREASMTPKDRDDVAWAVGNDFEYLALSFVRCASDVQMLRDLLTDLQSDVHIISKIETRHAVHNLDSIIEASDGVLVARGDLGVEMDVATIPRLQKDIIDRCHRTGTPVIVATQMLQSMVAASMPTRAEVSDVANAVYDGADALLLSEETAVGRYPIEAVEMLGRVAAETEKVGRGRRPPIDVCEGVSEVVPSVARSLCTVAKDMNAKAVIVWAKSGRLARYVSKHRMDLPVIALSASPSVRRRMSLYYGVTPVLVEDVTDPLERIAAGDRAVIDLGCARPGDMVVFGFGPSSLASEVTGSILVHKVEPV